MGLLQRARIVGVVAGGCALVCGCAGVIRPIDPAAQAAMTDSQQAADMARDAAQAALAAHMQALADAQRAADAAAQAALAAAQAIPPVPPGIHER